MSVRNGTYENRTKGSDYIFIIKLTQFHGFSMTALNYRVFEATVVLRSYKDPLIDMFDGKVLFERLYDEAEEHEMLRCGEGLAFKKGISVKGCHCMSFVRLLGLCSSSLPIILSFPSHHVIFVWFRFRSTLQPFAS